MELLPSDIKKIIIDILPIPDKRNLIRSCKYFNNLHYLIKSYETKFVELLHVTKFVSIEPIKFNQCELYALEYIYYDRANIPDKYLDYNKELLTKYALLYVNMAMNQTNVCKKIHKKYGRHINNIMCGAAYNGNLQLMKWAGKNGGCLRAILCNHVARNGHLEELKWLRKKQCPWDSLTCAFAAGHGHLEVLQWARKNGCEWNKYTCINAAANGHLEILKWARENGCDWDYSSVCIEAERTGHSEVLQWVQENGCA